MERLARVYGGLRGAMLVMAAVALFVVPEKALPGSTSEPARSVALMFGSRTVLLGLALVILAVTGRRRALAWVLLADAALQVFDAGLALAMDKGAVAALPVLIGALDAGAAMVLLRGLHGSESPAPRASDSR
ncbi:MAG: DUF4267 domain-containing protein [Myxococcales bacterium]